MQPVTTLITHLLQRQGVLLLLIFVTAYVTMLLTMSPPGLLSGVIQRQSAPATDSPLLAPVGGKQNQSSLNSTAPPAPAKLANDAAVPAAPPGVSVDIEALVQQAQHSEEREMRSDAIRQLAGVQDAQSVAALIYALRPEEDIRNRLLAISGLRQLGAQGVEVEEVRVALREAMNDSDGNVARHADEALRALL